MGNNVGLLIKVIQGLSTLIENRGPLLQDKVNLL